MTIAPANEGRSSSVSREYGMASSTMSDEASISSLLTRRAPGATVDTMSSIIGVVRSSAMRT
ncbi:MAG TPA: hypothetical protein VIL68_01575 [Propionibacteriaceae bacterium]